EEYSCSSISRKRMPFLSNSPSIAILLQRFWSPTGVSKLRNECRKKHIADHCQPGRQLQAGGRKQNTRGRKNYGRLSGRSANLRRESCAGNGGKTTTATFRH